MFTFLIVRISRIFLALNFIFIWPVFIAVYYLLILANIPNFLNIEPNDKINSQIGLQVFSKEYLIGYFYFVHMTILFFSIFSKMVFKFFQNQGLDDFVEINKIKKESNYNIVLSEVFVSVLLKNMQH